MADQDAATLPPDPPKPKLGDSEKLDRALGLLQLIADEMMAHGRRLDKIEAHAQALEQHQGGTFSLAKSTYRMATTNAKRLKAICDRYGIEIDEDGEHAEVRTAE